MILFRKEYPNSILSMKMMFNKKKEEKFYKIIYKRCFYPHFYLPKIIFYLIKKDFIFSYLPKMISFIQFYKERF